MGKVILSGNASGKLDKLVRLLYEKEYVGFRESGQAYVDRILVFLNTLPNQIHHRTRNNRYGNYYCRYKANSNTTWYFTFDTDGDGYLVKNVISNHTAEYPTYITDGD